MTSDLIYYASGFELLFLISAVIGAWFTRKNFWEAWTDFHALGGITNGRRAVAVGAIVTETILGSVHALYIIAALVAVNLPASGHVTPVGILIQSILVYASWGMTAISYTSRRVRLFLLSHGLQGRDLHGRFVKDD